MDVGLKERVVLVTGASTGIGKAIAIAFGKEGARVALTYRSKAKEAKEVGEAVRAAGGDPLVLQLKLDEPRSVADSVVGSVVEKWGPSTTIDVLVANAVRWPSGFFSIDEMPLEELEQSLIANVVGQVALVKAVLPGMRKQKWGRIVMISTGLVVDGGAKTIAYSTPKGAIHSFTRSLAREVAEDGILANVLMAGAVKSEARQRPPGMDDLLAKCAMTNRLTKAEEVANAALYLASAANGHITGESLRCDGFITNPARLDLLLPPKEKATGS
jgi:NAD(P)-dependent dehydrogenase (short-subunit alcohol dehydrogenase family)